MKPPWIQREPPLPSVNEPPGSRTRAASWRGSRVLTFGPPPPVSLSRKRSFALSLHAGPYYPVRLFPPLSLRPPGGSVTPQAQPQLLHPAPIAPPLAPGLARGVAGGCSRYRSGPASLDPFWSRSGQIIAPAWPDRDTDHTHKRAERVQKGHSGPIEFRMALLGAASGVLLVP